MAPVQTFVGVALCQQAAFTPEGSNELLLAAGELIESHITLLMQEVIIISFHRRRTASEA